MEKILELIEQSVLGLLDVHPDDLRDLAELHSKFQEIAEQTNQLNIPDAKQLETIQAGTLAAADLIEKIILDEVENGDTAIKAIIETARILQQTLEQLSRGDKPDEIIFPCELGLSSTDNIKQESRENSFGVDNDLQITLPDNVDEAIFREFLTNQPDVLDNLESAILTAEKNCCPENINAIKAILHNMKGEAGLMGLQEISDRCHKTESLLEETVDGIPVEQLLEAHDWLEKSISYLSNNMSTTETHNKPQANTRDNAENINVNNDTEDNTEEIIINPGDVELVTDFISEATEHLENAENELLKLEEDLENKEIINTIFRAFHTIKGVAGFLNLQHISSLAHVTENLLDLARKGELTISGTTIDIVFESIDTMKTMVAALQEALQQSQPVKPYKQLPKLIERIKLCATGQKPPARLGELLAESGAVDTDTIKEVIHQQQRGETNKKLGQILTEKKLVTPQQIAKAITAQKQQQASNAPAAKKISAERTVKVATSRMDLLIDMVGEMVIAQSMARQDIAGYLKTNQRLARNMQHLEKITRELQELSMSMRMVPVRGVFQKMARLVRDLSRKAGKEIEFVLNGEETEVDRNVVDAIADPLVHMIRNSVDHGIELPEDRLKAGKNKTGTIELRAFHEGGNIIIEIADDGKGLDRKRILEKAIANGIVKEDAELSDQDVYRLIFHAGLSTAQKITDISGRGVGMDVVRKNIEALRGRVDIESTPGKGSTFKIRLPLTLAAIDGQIISVGKERFIVPLLSIEQNLQPSQKQLSSIQGGKAEMLLVRGELLPLIRLHQLFNIEPEYTNPWQGLVVIVYDGEKRCGLLVDKLLGQQQAVIKSLGNYMGPVPGVSGGAIMGDGNVALILDVPGIINLALHSQKPVALTA